jgi:hypothetical protein
MRFSTLLPLVLATGALATPVLQRDTWSAPTDEVRNLLARDRHHGGDDSDSNSTIGSAFTPTPIHDCMTEGQATKIVNAFLYLLANPKAANFNATATALLTKHYTDTSDSINQLAGLPVGSCPFIYYSLFSVLDVPRPFSPTDACGNYRKDQLPSQAGQLSLLDPGDSPHSSSRPSISSTTATRSLGAGSLSTVLATTPRRLRASTSSRSARGARSRPPLQSSTAAPGCWISAR